MRGRSVWVSVAASSSRGNHSVARARSRSALARAFSLSRSRRFVLLSVSKRSLTARSINRLRVPSGLPDQSTARVLSGSTILIRLLIGRFESAVSRHLKHTHRECVFKIRELAKPYVIKRKTARPSFWKREPSVLSGRPLFVSGGPYRMMLCSSKRTRRLS